MEPSWNHVLLELLPWSCMPSAAALFEIRGAAEVTVATTEAPPSFNMYLKLKGLRKRKCLGIRAQVTKFRECRTTLNLPWKPRPQQDWRMQFIYVDLSVQTRLKCMGFFWSLAEAEAEGVGIVVMESCLHQASCLFLNQWFLRFHFVFHLMLWRQADPQSLNKVSAESSWHNTVAGRPRPRSELAN